MVGTVLSTVTSAWTVAVLPAASVAVPTMTCGPSASSRVSKASVQGSPGAFVAGTAGASST